ncbi:MAG: YdiU family protein [Gammaproteobacteria bacterium]|nr:YdiU family protein [Gammaproteobacteria bacterium]
MATHPASHSLDSMSFDNVFTRELPADPESSNTRRQVLDSCYSRVSPTPVAAPQLVAWSAEVCELLGIDPEAVHSDHFVQVFAGNRLLPDMDPYAMCYGGHQFGNWAGQLGDGRAINLGEVLNPAGERAALQLKGAGLTPYSRTADGLAVLRSSLREFLCSEAMFHLGVPTTRALSLITTGESVERDMFYDGHPQNEPGAVLCRVAPSFIRFGNFEIHAARQEFELLKRLADHTIKNHFPLIELGDTPTTNAYIKWFNDVCERTARMIVHWMRVGFVHGVMNTDNMSILGLTIDYGPYGWLENYDPNWTPNTTDAAGRRYRFGQQSAIAHWNLLQLANAIYPLINDPDPLENALSNYATVYASEWNQMMAAKLGFKVWDEDRDAPLITELHDLLPLVETDMTLFYRGLADLAAKRSTLQDNAGDKGLISPLLDAYYVPEQLTNDYRARLDAWLRAYSARLNQDGLNAETCRENMNAVNPKYVMRNYLAQLAIDKAETGDFTMVHELLDTMRHPYTEQPARQAFAEKRPDWARQRPGCSMLSCSS